MTAIDDLRASDTVRFSRIDYHLSSVLGERDRTSMALCKTKPSGQLSLTLTSADFNIPIPGLTFQFDGVASGSNVTWTLNQALDIWYSIAHITRVRGQLVTRVDEVPPMLSTNCAGAQRVVKSTLTTVGGANTLVIETSVGNATASNITIDGATCGQALEALFFNVRIRPDSSASDGCGNHFQLVGTRVRFTASVENFSGDGTLASVRYQWSVPPAVTVHGATDQRTLDVTLDGHGSTAITCQAIITTSLGVNAVGSSTARFAVVTQEEAEMLRIMCRLRQTTATASAVLIRGIGAGFTAGGIRFVDPLWDPVPHAMHAAVLAHAPSHFETAELRAVAENLASTATALAKQSTLVMEQHEHRLELEGDAAKGKPGGHC